MGTKAINYENPQLTGLDSAAIQPARAHLIEYAPLGGQLLGKCPVGRLRSCLRLFEYRIPMDLLPTKTNICDFIFLIGAH